MKKPIFLAFVILLFLISMAMMGCATVPTVPFPSTINISPPDQNLPRQISAFLGIWEGYWGGILPSRLAIEDIDLKKATCVYGWADHPEGRFKGGYSRHTAKVEEKGVIEWGGEDRPKFTFTMGKDFKTIEGKREFRGDISWVEMTKKK